MSAMLSKLSCPCCFYCSAFEMLAFIRLPGGYQLCASTDASASRHHRLGRYRSPTASHKPPATTASDIKELQRPAVPGPALALRGE
jgi:hypothetical protein